jgi:transposase
MDVLIERCAGLDVHRDTVVACVRKPGDSARQRAGEVRTFSTVMQGLSQLQAWLKSEGVTHVAMESTGVYWRPVYSVLEGGFELMLVNARHIKGVPGRKTDVRDCEWIAQLLECGLLRGSFVPPREIRDLRDLTRLRKSLIRERSHQVNRIAKTLELANIKLASVATDILGKSGRAILEALIAGNEDPEQLASLAQGLLKKKTELLREALCGRMTPHYAFLLRQYLQLVDTYDAQIRQLDARIEEATGPFAEACARLNTIPGVAARAAQVIIAEIGVDMSRFATAAHLASWARVCPGNHESAGKRQPVSTGKGAMWLRATLQEVAWAAVRTKSSYYRAFYHRLQARQGARKAIVAVQHALLVAIWHLLHRGVEHQDLGNDYFERRNKARICHHHLRRLQQLGYTVTIQEAKEAVS